MHWPQKFHNKMFFFIIISVRCNIGLGQKLSSLIKQKTKQTFWPTQWKLLEHNFIRLSSIP